MTDVTHTDSQRGISIAEYQQCISEATEDLFSSTCGVQLQLKQNDERLTSDGVVIGIISLVGDVEGTIFLGLPRQTASALVARFAGFEVPFDSPDMGDAAGELANILAGNVKKKLDAKGVKADISLPSVIRVESLEVLVQRDSVSVRICYDSPVGTLWTGVTTSKDDFPV